LAEIAYGAETIYLSLSDASPRRTVKTFDVLEMASFEKQTIGDDKGVVDTKTLETKYESSGDAEHAIGPVEEDGHVTFKTKVAIFVCINSLFMRLH